MIEYLNNFPEQIKEGIRLGNSIKPKKYNKVLVCGMGGSGISGYILKDLLDIPVFISQSYGIPEFIDHDTLVFIISYSGNTEETISMYRHAQRKTSNIVIIVSGGVLAEEDNVILIPSGLQPRYALPYLFFTIWSVLGNKDVKNLVSLLEGFDTNKPKSLARKAFKKIPAVYVDSQYSSIVQRWKENLNEDAKILVFSNVLPEMDHNEIEGDFSKTCPIILHDENEIYRLKKRINLTAKIIKANVILLKGKTKLEKLFYGIYFGDYFSSYLAEMYHVDPLKYKHIERLKELMRRR